MAKIKVSKTRLLEAIRNASGTTTGICELLGINRTTLGRYIEADPEIGEAIEYAKTRRTDRAEYKLMEAIERGEKWAIEFELRSVRGRARGYGQTMDITSDGKQIKGYIGWTPSEWQEDEEKKE